MPVSIYCYKVLHPLLLADDMSGDVIVAHPAMFERVNRLLSCGWLRPGYNLYYCCNLGHVLASSRYMFYS